MKKRFFAIFMVVAMVSTMLLGTAFSVFADDESKHCDDENCTVCTVADLINALPEAEDITVDNAAAVLAQIHAIDRLKGDLNYEDEDEYGKYEYDYMLDMVEAMPDPSGYGVNIPKRYQEALTTIQNLGVGGSLMITKKFALDDATLNSLDWPQVDATFTIKCMSHDSSFNGGQPLNVTLSDINNLGLSALYNNGFHYPTPDADGWVNTYILPAGTYKITETAYTAVTMDGARIATTPIYSGTNADGTEAEVTDDGIIVEVEVGKTTLAEVPNTPGGSTKANVHIPLTSKSITYGTPLFTNLLDWDTATEDGEPLSDERKAFLQNAMTSISTGVKIFIKKDSTEIPLEDFDLQVGEYTMFAAQMETDDTIYTFGGPVTVTISEKILQKDDFIVNAQDKPYDGTTNATLKPDILKKPNVEGGLVIKEVRGPKDNPEYVYDDVQVKTITGNFVDADPGKNKKVTYTITELSGADAGNYKLGDNGVIEGETTATIFPSIPDQDDDNVREPDTNDDSIYEGTKGRRYIPDQDGDQKAEPESQTEPGIYDGTNGKKKYAPDGKGNVEEVTGPDEKGIYDGIKDENNDGKPDNRYLKDSNGDGIPEKSVDDTPTNGSDTVPMNTYDVLDGKLVWITGSTEDLTFTIDAPAENFRQLLIGGDVVDSENYSYVSGSTIITLDADYLNGLKTGNYDVEALYTDGKAATTLKVKATSDGSGDGTDTGDDNATMIGFMLLLQALCIGGIYMAINKKRAHR